MRLLLNATKGPCFTICNLLAEVVTRLQNLASVDGVGVDWEVSVYQTHLAFDLVLGAIGQVTDGK